MTTLAIEIRLRARDEELPEHLSEFYDKEPSWYYEGWRPDRYPYLVVAYIDGKAIKVTQVGKEREAKKIAKEFYKKYSSQLLRQPGVIQYNEWEYN